MKYYPKIEEVENLIGYNDWKDTYVVILPGEYYYCGWIANLAWYNFDKDYILGGDSCGLRIQEEGKLIGDLK